LGKCVIDGNDFRVKNGDAVVVPAGAKLNVMNVDKKKVLKLYTTYAPPYHQDGLVRCTKEEAETGE